MFETVNLPIVVYFDTDTYIAECSSMQGAYAEGETPHEAMHNLYGVVEALMDVQGKDGVYDARFTTMVTDKIVTFLPIMRPSYATA